MFNSFEHSLLGLLGLMHHQPQQQAPAKQAQPATRPALMVRPPAAPRSGAGWNGLQQSTSLDGTLQGDYQDDQSNGLQGGMVNPGFVPFQAGQNPQLRDYGLNQILNRY